MKLTVFNHFGVGDTYESREFVLDLMKLYGVTSCEYGCRYPAVFADLPQIKCIPVNESMDMRKAWTRDGDHLLVNSWIGCRNAKTNPPGDYVLWPGVGCTVEHIYRMYQDYLSEIGLPPLPRSVVEYIPNIDYTRIKLGMIHDFLHANRGMKKILLCNGPTGSGHAPNFDFGEMLRHIPPRHDVLYIFTEGHLKYSEDLSFVDRNDVLFTDTLTERHPGGSDMLAISYLSQYCDLIVGRCSGAQMPCETLKNWMDSTKTLLSFTQHDNGATFVRHPQALGLKMKRVWSPADNPKDGAEVLRKVLCGG